MQAEQKIKLNVWGREFNIDLIFQNYSGQAPDELQWKTYQNFMKQFDMHMEEAYQAFEGYCAERYPEEIGSKFQNIFKYIIPRLIFIEEEFNGICSIGFDCYFRLNLEDNLVAKFENDILVEVGDEHIIG
ncbi:MAG: hypothetical protein ACI4C1_01005 [Lachnospiraceae bacterium]